MNKKLDTRRDAWNYDYVGPKKEEKPATIYHHWVHMADDSMNKTLKTAIYLLYGYGFYCVVVELCAKFFG